MKNQWISKNNKTLFEKNDVVLNNKIYHFWILSRPHYCDRGHFEWGSYLPQEWEKYAPSHYFFDLKTAVRELDDWIERLNNINNNQQEKFESIKKWTTDEEMLCQQKNWYQKQDLYIKHVIVNHHEIDFYLQKITTQFGDLWSVNIENDSTIDFADAFPRNYVHLHDALDETEQFIQWRYHQVISIDEEKSSDTIRKLILPSMKIK